MKGTAGRGIPATPDEGHCVEVGATPPTHATFGMSEACLDRTPAVGGVAPTYGRYATVQAIPSLAPMTWPVTELAASEHSKRNAAATPPRVPGRTAGTTCFTPTGPQAGTASRSHVPPVATPAMAELRSHS